MSQGNLARIDTAGMIASSVCAVHCVVSPVLVAVMSLYGLRAGVNEDAEWVLAGGSLMLGAASLLPSYLRLHRRTIALAIFASGTAVMLLGRIIVPLSAIEAVLVAVGGLMMAAGHVTNRWLCRTCPRCLDR
jgi:hypothetical protein